MSNDQPVAKSFLPWRLSWLTIVLALIALGSFIAVSGPPAYDVTPMMGVGGVEYGAPTMDIDVSSAPARGMVGSDLYYPYPYPNPDVPITDTREFLKIYYNAGMRTRDVSGLTRRVLTTVRGYGGRVDQESISQKYGSVRFSLPQSKYDSFRAEIEGFVGNRFLSVNVSSSNLLPQKVSIEEQKKQADTAVANIKYAQDWQKALETQDQTLLDNVATVTGVVSIQWISLWDIALLYLPGYWISTIFAILALLSFFNDRRRSLTISYQ